MFPFGTIAPTLGLRSELQTLLAKNMTLQGFALLAGLGF